MLSQTKNVIRELGSGLILRRASPEDAYTLAKFNAAIHGESEADGKRVAAWTRDLLTLSHPTLKPDDFTLVEEAATGRIVSSLNLIPQTWSYAGIEFGVGRPELVGTLPEFRGRSLVRIQFDEIHEWCLERGYSVQVITGIPYFYRQFGYEMALDLAGRRLGYEPHVPKLEAGEEEPYRIRPATEADLPFVASVYQHAVSRHALACVRSPKILQYELNGQSEDNINRYCMLIIEDKAGEQVGYFQHPDYLGQTGLTAFWYELKPGISWLAVTPSVVRYLWRTGQKYARREGKSCQSFGFMGGAEHPVYKALGKNLATVHEPYAFYMRVPDLASFLNHVKPALEKRLAKSIAAGHSREIKVSFYRTGLRLLLEDGKLAAIEPWTPTMKEEGDIAYPSLTFLQAVFGYRSFEELELAFADCWCNQEDVRVLMDILFPKKLSDVFPLA